MRDKANKPHRPVVQTLPAVSHTRARQIRESEALQAERNALKPDAIKALDRQLHRLKFLGIAVKLMNGSGGSLRREYDKLAASAGLTLRRQKGIEYWTKPPKTLHGSGNFENHFGICGEPIRCKDSCGLSGHLFDDITHDAAKVREYLELWETDITARRDRELEQYLTQAKARDGSISTNWPAW